MKNIEYIIKKSKELLCKIILSTYTYIALNILMPIIIPFTVDNAKINMNNLITIIISLFSQRKFCITFLIYSVIMALFYKIRKAESKITKKLSDMSVALEKLSGCTRSLFSYCEQKKDGGIFDIAAQFVCNALYEFFDKTEKGKKIKITVVKQFLDGEIRKYTIPGVKSKNNSYGQTVPKVVDNCKKYFCKILKKQEREYIILNEDEILEKFYFEKHKENVNTIKSYVAVPYLGHSDIVCFILQIDSNYSDSFGNSKDNVKKYISTYIWPFVELLKLAYTIDQQSIINMSCDSKEDERCKIA